MILTNPPAKDVLDAAELEAILRAVDPRVVLLSGRPLRRVIKLDQQIAGLGLQVPHRKTYVLSSERLLQLVDRSELQVTELAETVILIARPMSVKLNRLTRCQALVAFWRLLFHARIHLAFDDHAVRQRLTPAAVRERIHRIGQTEFDEIRRVLRQEKLLLSLDDRAVYEEFAAIYLELRHFAPALLPRYFPSLDLAGHVDEVLAQDVDAAGLFTATRPAEAPCPGDVQPVRSAPKPTLPAAPAASQEPLSQATAAAALGNNVRAAIRHLRNRRDAGALVEIDRLVDRLRGALDLDAQQVEASCRALAPLLPWVAEGMWPVEARLLYDLQSVALAHEREVFKPNLLGWLFSFGKKPLLDPLPHQQAVHKVKHLRQALKRLPRCRLSDADRHALGEVLEETLHRIEHQLRERFRPLVDKSLADVGLTPKNIPERVAYHKICAELLDRVVERGTLSLGDVRDAISRNQLKLPDLAGAGELVRGDALLRANRSLAGSLKGVYRYGEFYLRWLQRLSACAFGTPVGRWLTLFVFIPLGGSFVALEGLQYLVNKVRHLAGYDHHHDIHFVDWRLVLAVAVFLLTTMHWARFRAWVLTGTRLAGVGLRGVFIDLPSFVFKLSVLRAFLRSVVFAWLLSYVFKPALVALPVWLYLHLFDHFFDQFFDLEPLGDAIVAGVVFLGASLLLNSRYGRELEELSTDWATRTWWRTRDLFVGLFRLIQDVFKTFLEGFDRVLYSVDEWFRFRSGDSRTAFVLKLIFAPLWGLLAYLVRFLLLLFVEPQVNPIKHFPVVTVAHKMLLPLIPTFSHLLRDHFTLAEATATTAAVIIIGKIPGIFGFLVWELKENWRLYEANRPAELKPVMIGHHGETMLRFMKPGFHSGTLPKLHAKLRRAERRAQGTGSRRSARKFREQIHHAEESLHHFADRELVYLLLQSRWWKLASLHTGKIEAASNRVRIELLCEELPGPSLEIAFEEQSGWLLAGITQTGWLSNLDLDHRQVLETALAGFYKLAGVDLTREQIQAAFDPQCLAYDIADEGLVVWPNYETVAVYDLTKETDLTAEVREGTANSLPTLRRAILFYHDVRIDWSKWVETWNDGGRSKVIPDETHIL